MNLCILRFCLSKPVALSRISRTFPKLILVFKNRCPEYKLLRSYYFHFQYILDLALKLYKRN